MLLRFSCSDQFVKGCCPVTKMAGRQIVEIVLFFGVEDIACKHGVETNGRELYAKFFQDENVVLEILTGFRQRGIFKQRFERFERFFPLKRALCKRDKSGFSGFDRD